MSRIESRSKRASSNGDVLLVACMTAGDPNLTTTLVLMHSVAAQGGDIIKLVLPCPERVSTTVVLDSNNRALQHGTTVELVAELVSHFRQTDNDTPLIWQVQNSTIASTGTENLARMAVAAGVDAIQLADASADENDSLLNTLKTAGMSTIFLPTDEPVGATVIGTDIMSLTAEHGSQIDQLLSSVGALLNAMRPAATMV